MLQSLDVLIGLSVVMLMVSMSVTLITEWALTLRGMRGKKLLEGVTALLGQIDPKLKESDCAAQIAHQVLSHPMAARVSGKLAEVIQREELIKIVLEIGAGAAQQTPATMAAGAGAGAAGTSATTSTAAPSNAGQALVQALQRAGIPDPGATLDAVRMLSMRLEAARPDMATHVREATALITEAQSQFVANVNGWFDQTMDRVSRSYTNHSRYYTVGISLVLTLFLQLDAFKLVNRLSMDDALRASLVQQAQAQVAQPAPTPPAAATDLAQLQKETSDNVAQLRLLASDQLVSLPNSPGKWWSNWGQTSFLGVLVSGLLVSLGAPFWFKALGNLLKLRPSLAAKEDQQRAERAASQTPAGGLSAAALAAAVGSGERGDLTAG
jgi:hypothetical protein